MQRLASPVDRSHTSWEVLLDRPSFFASFFESYTLAVSNGTPWDRRGAFLRRGDRFSATRRTMVYMEREDNFANSLRSTIK